MIKRIFYISAIIILSGQIFYGQQEEAPKDAKKQEMPKLEIPEITIVGKKVITLPFAKKGELYDVDIYKAPEPDSSLIEDRVSTALPSGSFPAYEERRRPFRLAVDGSVGSFAIAMFQTYFDYNALKWGFNGSGNYGRTSGHVKNADAAMTKIDINTYSLINTDNEILKSLRLSGGLMYSHDRYGLFGIVDEKVERSRNQTAFNVMLGSIRKEGISADVGLTANILSIKDNSPANEIDMSAFTPSLNASFGADVANIRWTSDLLYKSSSLDSKQDQSPSLINLNARTQWYYDKWLILLGGVFADASSADEQTSALIRPTALIRWNINRGSELSFWYQPDMKLTGYHEYINNIPYLERDIKILPENSPLHLGSSYSYTSEKYSYEGRVSFSKILNKSVVIADSEKIFLNYITALQTIFQLNGSIKITQNLFAKATAVVQPTYEEGGSDQIPMIPLVKGKLTGEYSFDIPFTLSSTFEYWSGQNIGLKSEYGKLDDVVLLGIGASSRVLPRTLLSFEISNLLNTKYYWWKDYRAPGIQFMLNAQVNVW